MSTAVLAAEGSVEVGKFWSASIFGFTVHLDTVLGTIVAGGIVCGLGLYMARGATKGRPTKLQVAYEALTGWAQGQIRDGMGLRAPRGVLALAVALFAFILIANWLAALPTEHWLPPPTADANLAYALMILVIVWVNVAGIRARGIKGFLGHFAHPIAGMAPLEVLTNYFSRPLSLSLRLWGNIFGGVLMVKIIGLMPAYVLWLPNAAWKLFDMFIGGIQALIFALLTIIYFSDAVGGEDEAAEH